MLLWCVSHSVVGFFFFFSSSSSFFFFQAEDGIRARLVTGVQTCALPIYEGGTPHDSVVTDALGRYSVVATAGNHTLTVSMGEFGSDYERLRLTSNNILARKVGILISEAQATRATQPEIRIDIEVEAASLSGELYWDAGEREPIAGIPVTATQTATGREFSVDSSADGSFAFDAIAPGEYRVTADLNGHELELANYEGVAGLRADQSLEIDGAVVPASVLGLIGPGIGYIPGMGRGGREGAINVAQQSS